MRNIKNLLKKKIVLLDGATGTELQKRGMPQGVCPELWCVENSSKIAAVHADYSNAGADIVYTCTFGANKYKLGQYKAAKSVLKVNRQLAQIARHAVSKNTLVAGDIGPTGKFVEPFGNIAFEDMVKVFKEQVKGLLAGGVDLFVIETMIDIQEARAALIAVKELCDLFTIVTMTYESNGRTLNGTDPVSALITLQSLGADAVGCNCSAGPEQMLPLLKSMKPYSRIPLVAKPNAGMPKLVNGQTVFQMTPKFFGTKGAFFACAGIGFLGGCCGTTPDHIKDLKKKVAAFKPQPPKRKSISALSSARGSVLLEGKIPLVKVGERINPTGKKLLKEELRNKKFSLVAQMAKEQELAGAAVLDVNVGVSGVDEVRTLSEAVKKLSISSALPLVIDSSDTKAIEQALRIYPGRALINSISGEKKKLKELLPLAKKYGAMFVLLPLTEKEIPETFNKRKKIITSIVKQAKQVGFFVNDIVVDGLVMTVSSNPQAAIETMKTIKYCTDTLKVNTIVGLSNISFGLPARNIVNATYLKLLRDNGLSLVIINPQGKKVNYNKKAANVLLGLDKDAAGYIAYCQKNHIIDDKKVVKKKNISAKELVYQTILEGNREDIISFIKVALDSGIKPDVLVNNFMIPGINKVGDLFDKKKYFLPQLIASAEAMKKGFEYLEPLLKKTAKKAEKKTVIVLATVQGDIHDIGKNIVGLMLKNHGFDVIDLGKDVSSTKIIKEAKKHKDPIIGLSALMTTTMVNMPDIIERAKNSGLNCRFIVGGAVVTKSYAHSIGAAYAADGVEAVRVAKGL